MCLSFWRKNIEEINTPYYSSSSWRSWAQPQGSLGSQWRPRKAPLGVGPVWPGFLRWNKRTRPVCPLLTSPWVWATPRQGLPWVGRLPVVEAAEGHSSTAPSKWDSQPFTIWCQIAVFITVQLYCFVFFFFETSFFFQTAPNTSQTSRFSSSTHRRLLRSEVLLGLLVPIFPKWKVTCGKSVTVTGNPTGLLPLSQGSATAEPSYFAIRARGCEATVFGFLSWRLVTSQGSAPPQEHQEPSRASSPLTAQYGARMRWEWTKLSQTTAKETKRGILRERVLPHFAPLPGSLCCVWAPAWLSQTRVSIRDVFSGGAITHSPGESQLQPLQRQSWRLGIVGHF